MNCIKITHLAIQCSTLNKIVCFETKEVNTGNTLINKILKYNSLTYS